VRLLLDEHLSWRRVAPPLREVGHDVLAVQEETSLRTLSDADLLQVAAEQERILVTCNGKDFEPLSSDWADLGRGHAGIVLIWTKSAHEHESIATLVSELLTARPDATDWRNLVLAV
jgi:hypothetical protein